jgi:hypothetical protein
MHISGLQTNRPECDPMIQINREDPGICHRRCVYCSRSMLYHGWDLGIQSSVIRGRFFWEKGLLAGQSHAYRKCDLPLPCHQSSYFTLVFFSVSLATWAAQSPGSPHLYILSPGRFYTLRIFLATHIQSFVPLFRICNASFVSTNPSHHQVAFSTPT